MCVERFVVCGTGRGPKLKKIENARMAELVDALVSGTSVGYNVQVRVLFRALFCAGGEIGIHATLRG